MLKGTIVVREVGNPQSSTSTRPYFMIPFLQQGYGEGAVTLQGVPASYG